MTDPHEPSVGRFRQRQNNARTTAVIGFAMMFGAFWYVGFAVGGALTVLYSLVAYFYWGHRIRKLKGDPWAHDPELDGPKQPEWRRP